MMVVDLRPKSSTGSAIHSYAAANRLRKMGLVQGMMVWDLGYLLPKHFWNDLALSLNF